jgi:protein-L-isoaspartate O-methyltransferase
LVAAGKLRSPEWIAAVRAIPRHALVPVIYDQNPGTGEWLAHDATDPAWQERIYANRGLFTKIGEGTGSWGTAVVGLSSTSTPGLMTRMLETLDIHKGHDVLEIGTGTGYNAALLAHRLGAEHVFSVDIDRELVDLARDRLARIGYRPTLVVADGADGLPEHALYDRIIATCSVPAIPRTWLEQTRIGGLILADLKLSIHAGNLVLLTRLANRAEGRFDRTWAGFMALRPNVPATVAVQRVTRDRAQATVRTTELDQRHPGDNLVAWFLAQHCHHRRAVDLARLPGW